MAAMTGNSLKNLTSTGNYLNITKAGPEIKELELCRNKFALCDKKLNINAGGTPHTSDEIERVKKERLTRLFEKEQQFYLEKCKYFM